MCVGVCVRVWVHLVRILTSHPIVCSVALSRTSDPDTMSAMLYARNERSTFNVGSSASTSNASKRLERLSELLKNAQLMAVNKMKNGQGDILRKKLRAMVPMDNFKEVRRVQGDLVRKYWSKSKKVREGQRLILEQLLKNSKSELQYMLHFKLPNEPRKPVEWSDPDDLEADSLQVEGAPAKKKRRTKEYVKSTDRVHWAHPISIVAPTGMGKSKMSMALLLSDVLDKDLLTFVPPIADAKEYETFIQDPKQWTPMEKRPIRFLLTYPQRVVLNNYVQNFYAYDDDLNQQFFPLFNKARTVYFLTQQCCVVAREGVSLSESTNDCIPPLICPNGKVDWKLFNRSKLVFTSMNQLAIQDLKEVFHPNRYLAVFLDELQQLPTQGSLQELKQQPVNHQLWILMRGAPSVAVSATFDDRLSHTSKVSAVIPLKNKKIRKINFRVLRYTLMDAQLKVITFSLQQQKDFLGVAKNVARMIYNVLAIQLAELNSQQLFPHALVRVSSAQICRNTALFLNRMLEDNPLYHSLVLYQGTAEEVKFNIPFRADYLSSNKMRLSKTDPELGAYKPGETHLMGDKANDKEVLHAMRKGKITLLIVNQKAVVAMNMPTIRFVMSLCLSTNGARTEQLVGRGRRQDVLKNWIAFYNFTVANFVKEANIVKPIPPTPKKYQEEFNRIHRKYKVELKRVVSILMETTQTYTWFLPTPALHYAKRLEKDCLQEAKVFQQCALLDGHSFTVPKQLLKGSTDKYECVSQLKVPFRAQAKLPLPVGPTELLHSHHMNPFSGNTHPQPARL